MAKAQTDIRSTSYDSATANAHGYQGTIDDALAQIRAESDQPITIRTRTELLRYLGVDRVKSNSPSTQMDLNPRYGLEEVAGPSFYSLAYALKHFPGSFLHKTLHERLEALTSGQQIIYLDSRTEHGMTVEAALKRAEGWPA